GLESVRGQLRHVIQPRSEVDQRPEVIARLAGKIVRDVFGGESIEIAARVIGRSSKLGEDVARAAYGVLQVRAGLASELQSFFKIESDNRCARVFEQEVAQRGDGDLARDLFLS